LTAEDARPPRLRAPGAVAVFLLILVLHGAYVLWTGVRISPDSHVYDFWSGRLIATGFDYGRLLGEVRTSYPAILYALFVTLVAGLKMLFGSGWTLALVALNVVAHAALGAMLVRLIARIVAGPVAAWAGLLLYLASFDLLQWVPFVLSDTSFLLLIFAIFTMAATRILAGRGKWLPVFGAAAAAIFYRPTGIVLLPDLAWALYLARSKGTRIARTKVFAFLCAATLAGALLFAWIVQHPPVWDGTIGWTLRETSHFYALGEVVHDRPETAHAPPTALISYLAIIADRFVHFFAPTASAFGPAHSLAQWLFFLPCYALGLWFVFLLLRGRTALPPPARDVCFAALGAVFAYASVHALLQVDYDWRYRLPVLPHMILLAAAGASELARRIKTG
jgi:hypothetical protein